MTGPSKQLPYHATRIAHEHGYIQVERGDGIVKVATDDSGIVLALPLANLYDALKQFDVDE